MEKAKAVKKVNFTDAQVKRMSEVYGANPNKAIVDMLATEFGKSTRSVIAKLVNMGIYVKADKAETDGEAKAEKKEAIVSEIAKYCNVADEVVESLAGSAKKALTAVRDALAEKFASEADGNKAEA